MLATDEMFTAKRPVTSFALQLFHFTFSDKSDFNCSVRIGSEEMVTINHLAEMVMKIAGKKLTIKHIPGPLAVRGGNYDNRLI